MASVSPLNLRRLFTRIAIGGGLVLCAQAEELQAHERGARSSYSARVLRVIDGDSFVVRIKIWEGIFVTPHIRLSGVDAPEFPPRARCSREKVAAAKAKQRLKDLLGKRVHLRAIRHGEDRYARVLAEAYLSPSRQRAHRLDTRDVGQVLLSEGLVKPYQGGKKFNWCLGSKRSEKIFLERRVEEAA